MVIRNLVLGSSGFVGKDFCRFLEDKGEIVIPFDIKRGTHEDAREVKLPLDKVDRVYFLAWLVGGSKFLYKKKNQISQMEWNLKLMQNIFPQLQKWNKPFLFISSQLAEEKIVYGVQKLLGELWTKLLPKGRIIRLWNIYGSVEEDDIHSHVVSDFVRRAVETQKIEMLTNGQELKQFIYKDDVHRAFHKAIRELTNKICDVTSFKWIPLIKVAEIISKLTGAKIIPGNQKGKEQMTLTIGKLQGWEPRIKLKEGLKKMIIELLKKSHDKNEEKIMKLIDEFGGCSKIKKKKRKRRRNQNE